MMEKKVNTAEVARKAAQIISERGLAKGVLMDSGGRVCHDGAIFLALGLPITTESRSVNLIPGVMIPPEYCAVLGASEKVLRNQGISTGAVFLYNDRESTSAEDIILLFKEAAQLLEEA